MKRLLILLVLLASKPLFAQRFFAAGVLGFNGAQIDGDNAAGYGQWGLTGGFKIDYPLKEAWDISTELLYSKRGAKDRRDKLDIDLHYIEIPLLISVRDWYLEKEGYDKVRAEVGLSYGYLFNRGANKASLTQPLLAFNQNDISLIAGAGYMFTKKMGLAIRYTRSVVKLHEPIFEDGVPLLNYFVTMRSEYHF
jgi:hypothetical protein